MLDKTVELQEIRALGNANYLLTLISPEQARLTCPGHFVMLKCSDDANESPLLRRPFSIFATTHTGRSRRLTGLQILVKAVGPGTHKLVEARPGDKLHCLGPQGQPFRLSPKVPPGTVAYLVAGGVGIAALYLLARALLAKRVTPVLFYGGRSASDLVLREYFEQLPIETHYTTEDGSLGQKGLVTRPLARFLKERSRKNLRLYCCGPWAMMKATHELALLHGVPCEVSLEARMGCSLGACMGCVIRAWDDRGDEQYLRVCLEGPVMNSQIVDWDTPPF